jgi:hypothetical protein
MLRSGLRDVGQSPVGGLRLRLVWQIAKSGPISNRRIVLLLQGHACGTNFDRIGSLWLGFLGRIDTCVWPHHRALFTEERGTGISVQVSLDSIANDKLSAALAARTVPGVIGPGPKAPVFCTP